MQGKFLTNLGRIAGIGGIALGVFLLIFQAVLGKDFFPQLRPDHAFRVVMALLIFTFGISGLGLFCWLIGKFIGPATPMSASILGILAAMFVFVITASIVMPASLPDPPPPPAPTPVPTPDPAPKPEALRGPFKFCFGITNLDAAYCNDARGKYDCDAKNGWKKENWDELAKAMCETVNPAKYITVRTRYQGGGRCGLVAHELYCTR